MINSQSNCLSVRRTESYRHKQTGKGNVCLYASKREAYRQTSPPPVLGKQIYQFNTIGQSILLVPITKGCRT